MNSSCTIQTILATWQRRSPSEHRLIHTHIYIYIVRDRERLHIFFYLYMFCVFFLYTIQILIHRKEISFLYKCLTTHIYRYISMYACVYIGQCSQYDDGCSSNNCRKSTAMSGLRLFHIE